MHCYTISAVSHQQDVLRGALIGGLSRHSHNPPDRSPGEEACAEGFNSGRLAFVQHVSATCRPNPPRPFMLCCREISAVHVWLARAGSQQTRR